MLILMSATGWRDNCPAIEKISNQGNTMRTTSLKNPNYTVKLKLPEIRQHIYDSKPKMGQKQSKAYASRLINFLKKVVLVQLNEGRVILDLSDDAANGAKLGLSPSQAKRDKGNLSKLGILYVPEYGRQKKMGDYPIWLINYDYTVKEYIESDGKKQRRPVSDFYNKKFIQIHEEATAWVNDRFKEMDWKPSAKEFSIARNIEITERLKELETTRDDYRL